MEYEAMLRLPFRIGSKTVSSNKVRQVESSAHWGTFVAEVSDDGQLLDVKPYADDADATTQFSADEIARYAADEEQLLDEDGVADDPEAGSQSVIPPASQAANRRSQSS